METQSQANQATQEQPSDQPMPTVELIPAIDAVMDLYMQGLLPPTLQRVELKRLPNGHWRAYIACGPNTSFAYAEQVLQALDTDKVTVNPFRKAQSLVSLQIVSNLEQ